MNRNRTPRVAIIGAGMSGIGMGVQLKKAGIDTFDIFERADNLGGTWRANTYPGIACDVPSHYYSYTFAPNPEWSSVMSSGAEIWAYLDQVARKFDVRDRIRFNSAVSGARWTGVEWILSTEDGFKGVYDFVVSAAGGLVYPNKPKIDGLENFGGASFHSAEWDHSVQLVGKRIGVIGSGSTGVQLIRALAGVAGHLEHYNRTPQWILPLPNHKYSRLHKQLYRWLPVLSKVAYRARRTQTETIWGKATIQPGWQRNLVNKLVRGHLKKVEDPDLRRRLTPAEEPMCKRIIMSEDFYEKFSRDDVELVDVGIDHVTPEGIVTRDGKHHELDIIVLATGFDAHAFLRPVELINETTGTRLSELWSSEPFAYRSVALPGFPNFFMLIGPHSPFGNQSLFTISESQARFVMIAVERWRAGLVDALAPTMEATTAFNEKMREAFPRTTWATGCNSWYLGADGLPHAWPFSPGEHRKLLSRLDEQDWDMELRATTSVR